MSLTAAPANAGADPEIAFAGKFSMLQSKVPSNQLFAFAAINHTAYFFGGGTSHIYALDLANDTSIMLTAKLPADLDGGVAVVLDGKIHLFGMKVGGGQSPTAYSNIIVFDPTTESVEEKPLFGGRDLLPKVGQGVAINRSAYFVQTYYEEIVEYNFDKNTLSLVDRRLPGSATGGTAVVGSEMLLFVMAEEAPAGQLDFSPHPPPTRTALFNPETGRLRFPASKTTVLDALLDPKAVTLDARVLVFGPHGTNSDLNLLAWYDPGAETLKLLEHGVAFGRGTQWMTRVHDAVFFVGLRTDCVTSREGAAAWSIRGTGIVRLDLEAPMTGGGKPPILDAAFDDLGDTFDLCLAHDDDGFIVHGAARYHRDSTGVDTWFSGFALREGNHLGHAEEVAIWDNDGNIVRHDVQPYTYLPSESSGPLLVLIVAALTSAVVLRWKRQA